MKMNAKKNKYLEQGISYKHNAKKLKYLQNRSDFYIDSTCFVYRLYAYNRQSECYGAPSNVSYWILSVDAECRSIHLVEKLVSVNPDGTNDFSVVVRDDVTELTGYRWMNAVPLVGQYQEYTICVKGSNVQTVNGDFGVVAENGYYANDGYVQVPVMC